MGYFFSFVSIVITLYWVYRGIKRGLYPALNILLVFFIPLLITLNYYDLLFNLVGRIAPDTSPTTRETISFIGTYLLSFTLCLYFCLWLCADVLRLHKLIDSIGGGFVGAVTGIVCCGVLMLIWFSLPVARLQFPVNDTEMFFPVHKLTMKMTTYVAHRIEGARRFSGERYFRDLRYGLPQMPSTSEGYYVASIPNGLRVFIEAGGGDPQNFLTNIKKRLETPDEDVKPSEQRASFGERHRTPIFIGSAEGGGGSGGGSGAAGEGALIAMLMDDVPHLITETTQDPAKMFVHDNEIFFTSLKIGDRDVFIKIYRVPKLGNIGPIVGLFQPQDDRLPGVIWAVMAGKDPDKIAEELAQNKTVRNESEARDLIARANLVVDFLPSSAHFRFDESDMITRLMASGATHEEAQGMIPMLKFGGKTWFIGREKKPWVAEVIGDNKYRIEEVKVPEIPKDERPGNNPRR